MTLKVANKRAEGAKVRYLIIDTDDNSIAGRVIVNFHKNKSWWYYKGADGLIVNDRGTRRAMDNAIRSHNGNEE